MASSESRRGGIPRPLGNDGSGSDEDNEVVLFDAAAMMAAAKSPTKLGTVERAVAILRRCALRNALRWQRAAFVHWVDLNVLRSCVDRW